MPIVGKYAPGGPKPYGPRSALFNDSRRQEIAPLISLLQAISKERGKTPAQVRVCQSCNCYWNNPHCFMQISAKNDHQRVWQKWKSPMFRPPKTVAISPKPNSKPLHLIFVQYVSLFYPRRDVEWALLKKRSDVRPRACLHSCCLGKGYTPEHEPNYPCSRM